MNIFSNLGITELVLILLLARVVVGPERLPELGRKLGKTLRDVRTIYDNLSSELGPEFASMQQSTQDLRESVESIRSIPQDLVQSVVKAAELDDAIGDLKEVADSVGQMGKTLSAAPTDLATVIKDPVNAAVTTARSTLLPGEPAEKEKVAEAGPEKQQATQLDETAEETEDTAGRVDDSVGPVGQTESEPTNPAGAIQASVDSAIPTTQNSRAPADTAGEEKTEPETEPEELAESDQGLNPTEAARPATRRAPGEQDNE